MLWESCLMGARKSSKYAWNMRGVADFEKV